MDIAVHRCPLMGIDGHQQACDSMEMLCFTARKSAQVVHSMLSALSREYAKMKEQSEGERFNFTAQDIL